MHTKKRTVKYVSFPFLGFFLFQSCTSVLHTYALSIDAGTFNYWRNECQHCNASVSFNKWQNNKTIFLGLHIFQTQTQQHQTNELFGVKCAPRWLCVIYFLVIFLIQLFFFSFSSLCTCVCRNVRNTRSRDWNVYTNKKFSFIFLSPFNEKSVSIKTVHFDRLKTEALPHGIA